MCVGARGCVELWRIERTSTGDGLPTGETLPDGGNGVPMRTRIGTTERELDLVGPSEYVPAGVVAPFRAATGCDVQVTTPASSREMLEMVPNRGVRRGCRAQRGLGPADRKP